MRAFTRRRFWVALRYRLCVTGACLAYLLTALEIPLPVFIHKNNSQPFPCQNHPCGCQTAEQCWSHCCCFTPEERWAWARGHNVEPPAYAEKPAAPPSSPSKVGENEGGQGWNTVKLRDRDRGTAATSCCRAKAEQSSCCRSADRTAKSPSSQSGRFRWGTTMAAWRCQGYSTLWISAGAVLPVPPLAAWTPDWTPPTRLCLPSLRADNVPSTPLDPPPRLSLV